ncbi:hypothetical protein [Verrucosispora sp. ts21]|uniref:hypothetical protein n=1 Tax=Verrucosispora sp. ts21 TaxID=2069341 RepID=UPI0011AF8936|nr:hypothetical protein [Verrucosispora sp. ts21]
MAPPEGNPWQKGEGLIPHQKGAEGQALPPYEVSKTYEPQGGMQLHRLALILDFTCARCKRAKKAKLVAVIDGDWSKLTCNGCYGLLVSRRPSAMPVPATQPQEANPLPLTTETAGKDAQGMRLGTDAGQAEELAGELRQDLHSMARLLRRRAAGKALTRPQRMALDKLASSPVRAGALRYAEVLVEGEIQIADLSAERGDKAALQAIKASLSGSSRDLLKRYRNVHVQPTAQVTSTGRSRDHLDALVLRQVAGEDFGTALAGVTALRGLRADVVDSPKKDLWGWLEANQLDGIQQTRVPTEVRRLRELDGKAFLDLVITDARAGQLREMFTHKALVERWAARAQVAEATLRGLCQAAHTRLVGAPGSSLKNDELDRYWECVRAYAHVCAQGRIAEIGVMQLRDHIARLRRRPSYRQLRGECLNRAAADLAKANPTLAEEVLSACTKHRAICNLARTGQSCEDCVPIVAADVNWPRPPGATDDAADGRDEVFVCPGVLDETPAAVAHLVAVAAADFEAASGVVGYAWLTEEGELRTGTDRATGVHDSNVHAICRASLDLLTGASNVQVTSRDGRAVEQVRHILRLGHVPESLNFSCAAHTRLLLAQVVEHGRQLTVSHDPCAEIHRGAQAAARLASLASMAAQGRESSAVVQAVADRVSQEFGQAMGGRLTAPDEEDDHAWWLVERSNETDLAWRTALYRMHIEGGWCVLPDGQLPLSYDQRRLRLRLEHRGQGPAVVQPVTLRHRGGQWEIAGIQWPANLLPGTILTFTWRYDASHLNARTGRLPNPERVGGLEYQHRYDPQVVTRETAPGSEQDREVPDLSDASWVLRTLRKLGYLSAEGEAILAEDALVRNCLEVGLPRHRADRIGAAVEQLLRSGRLHRVQGSIDYDGRPWFPPRPGHVRTPLLRYVPQVQALPKQRETSDEWRRHRRGHWVSGFVRRLPPGAQASAEQIEAHRDAVRAHELVARDLPEGFTYVRRHRRARR